MIEISKDTLYQLYIVEQKNTREIGELYNCNNQKISRLLHKYNIKTRRSLNQAIYIKNEKYFTIPTIENCYWAGFIAADGCIRHQKGTTRLMITLSKKDRVVLEKFKAVSQSTSKIIDIHKNSSWHSNLTINNCSQWGDDLYKNWNITPRKSLTLQSPNITNLEQQLAYIIGLIDGDGCISIYSNSRCPNTTIINLNIRGTIHILTWIRDVLSSLEDMDKYINKKITISNIADCCSLSYSHKRAYNILKYLEKIPINFKLSRKWDKIAEYEDIKHISNSS